MTTYDTGTEGVRKALWRGCYCRFEAPEYEGTSGAFGPAGGAQWDILDAGNSVVVTGAAFSAAALSANSTDGLWGVSSAWSGSDPATATLHRLSVTRSPAGFPAGADYKLRFRGNAQAGYGGSGYADHFAQVVFDVLTPATATAAGQTVTEALVGDSQVQQLYTGGTAGGWSVQGVAGANSLDIFNSDDDAPLGFTFSQSGDTLTINVADPLTGVTGGLYVLGVSDGSDNRFFGAVILPAPDGGGGGGGGGGGTPPARRRRVCGC